MSMIHHTIKHRSQSPRGLPHSFGILGLVSLALISIVGVSLYNASTTASSDLYASRADTVSPVTTPATLHSLDTTIDQQKSQIDKWIVSWFSSAQDPPQSTESGAQGGILPQGQPEYTTFSLIKNKLSGQSCEQKLWIDHTATKRDDAMNWALGHCLIQVSDAHKLYPDDYLTHTMMRVIAERAGLSVKMEYASDQIVTRTELYEFINALQRHHQIADIPSVVLGDRVRRSQYIELLYQIFTSKIVSDSVENTTRVAPAATKTGAHDTFASTLKQQLAQYASDTLLQASDTASQEYPPQPKSIGLNTQALMATKERLQQWLGRS